MGRVIARTDHAVVELTAGGLPRRLELDGLSLLQHPASDLEDGSTGLWLRLPDGEGGLEPRPLLGVGCGGQVLPAPDEDGHGPVVVTHHPRGITARTALRLGGTDPGPRWYWHVELTADEPVDCDVVAVQDIALAPWGAVRTNEHYVCQYLDHTPVEVAGHGTAVAVRQNMPGTRQPWALLGGLGEITGWATDALQLTGRDRLDGEPLPGLRAPLPSSRLEHEHGVVALQSATLQLRPGTTTSTGFWGLLLADHPAATGPDDARWADIALADPAAAGLAAPGGGSARAVPGSVFAEAPVLRCLEEPPAGSGSGAGDVTARDQRAVLRPHGHLLRTGAALVPDERTVTCTSWMAGSFWSQVTQGHVGRGSILSLRRGYLGLQQAHGLRLLVDADGSGEPAGLRLLGVPTSWHITPGGCRWEYRPVAAEVDRGLPERLTVTVTAPTDAHRLELTVTADRPVTLLAALHVVATGDDGALPGRVVLAGGGTSADDAGATITLGAGTVRLDWPAGSVAAVRDAAALVVPPGGSAAATAAPTAAPTADAPWLVLPVPATTGWSLTLTPQLLTGTALQQPDDDTTALRPGFWDEVRDAITLRADGSGAAAAELARLDEILPWYAHDALVHYLSPRGLEQFSGGAWGTRDVCQGPVGLLLALGEHDAVRAVCWQLLRAQHARGDWPQWFEMYDRYVDPEQRDAHGDVVYWPLLAIGEYLTATADGSLLTEQHPFIGDGVVTAPAGALSHLAAALDLVDSTLIPGTSLPAYGHGDWNDSLQPADPALAAGLCSSWTVVLQAHALTTLADGLDAVRHTLSDALAADAADLAARCRRLADAGAQELRQLLLADDVIAGYGLFDRTPGTAADATDVRPSALLVHPRDERTGLRWSILPMIHAISGRLLDPDQAAHHVAVVREHLTGPDGARLFDAPVAYHGGPMRVFQRAEAATFFGREIGIMYTHAHLRWAEALAHLGDGPGLLGALALANPIGMTERVPSARPRQRTTYFSSSDAAFPDRASAAAGYPGVLDGSVPLEGGWRVYSSGPGLYLRLVTEQLLGVRRRADRVELDPVLDPALGTVTARVPVAGRVVTLRLVAGPRGHGVTRVHVDDSDLATTPLENPYRAAGVAVATADLLALLDGGAALTVELG